MNRLQNLFGKKPDGNLLSVYFTAGFPTLDSTVDIIRSLEMAGVDMIEVGVPFSDPMADGPVIQESSSIAIKNGMNLGLIFDQVEEARKTGSQIPLVLMGYLNPMIQFGIERLFERCKECGIDALIVPDLPFDEYLSTFKNLCERYDIPLIMLITPETSDERIKLIDQHCDGFIYMVSTAATTGTRDSFAPEQIEYFKRVNNMGLRHQRLIGFGISNPSTLKQAQDHSAGAIIGSLFIKCLKQTSTVDNAVKMLLSTLGVKR